MCVALSSPPPPAQVRFTAARSWLALRWCACPGRCARCDRAVFPLPCDFLLLIWVGPSQLVP
ncbi:hypothetical protein BC828DRAFT_378215 [Blastocladiella britannica]|nr:hypothetical protein BC828DRAFT_378215 [Blastocladiella britannica]